MNLMCVTLDTNGDGIRGLVACQQIQAKDLIMVSPALRVQDRDTLGDSLWPYVWDTDYGDLFVVGMPAFLNHSDDPNVTVTWKQAREELYCQVTAARTIDTSDEVTHRYPDIDLYRDRGLV